MIETVTIGQAPIAIFDAWGRKLFGGFPNKGDATLWLLNNVPWKLLKWNPELLYHKEVRRVPTEFEADLYIRHDTELIKSRCDPKDYVVCVDLRPYTNEVLN